MKKYLEGDEAAKKFVQDIMNHLVHNMRVHGEGGGNIADLNTVVRGMLMVLKEIPKTVRKVSVSVPEGAKRPEKYTRFPKEAPRWTERPQPADVVINSRKECLDIVHKLNSLYDSVDHLIEPEHVERVFPQAFGKASEYFDVKLPKAEKVAGLMVYRIAECFANRDVEYLTELELLSR